MLVMTGFFARVLQLTLISKHSCCLLMRVSCSTLANDLCMKATKSCHDIP